MFLGRTSEVLDGRTVTVYGCGLDDAPTVYSSMYQEAGVEVLEKCAGLGCRPFNLVSVSGLDWNSELSPWEADPVTRDGAAFSGHAGEYSDFLTGKVIPFAESILGGTDLRVVAGYSMAGLFAVYAPYVTDAFSRCVSASGSLWFPGFLEFAESHDFVRRPDAVYLSLGDRESRKGNPVMSTVEARTRGLLAHLRSRGIESVFELNPGNHFRDAPLRLARGITWALP